MKKMTDREKLEKVLAYVTQFNQYEEYRRLLH